MPRFQKRNTTRTFQQSGSFGTPLDTIWKVKVGGSTIATNVTPNGWNVSLNIDFTFTSTADYHNTPSIVDTDFITGVAGLDIQHQIAWFNYSQYTGITIQEQCLAEWTNYPRKYGNNLTVYVARPTGIEELIPVGLGSWATGVWNSVWPTKAAPVSIYHGKVWYVGDQTKRVSEFSDSGTNILFVAGTSNKLKLQFDAIHDLYVFCTPTCPLGVYDSIVCEISETPGTQEADQAVDFVTTPLTLNLKVVVYDESVQYPPENVDAAADPPEQPTGVRWESTAGAGVCEGPNATIQWDTVLGATGYRLYQDNVEIYDGIETLFLVEELRVGRPYEFYVVAYNDEGDSEESETITVVPCETVECLISTTESAVQTCTIF